MIPAESFFIVLDITGYKDDILSCNLIVYPAHSTSSKDQVIIQKALHFFKCEFSDQATDESDGSVSESSTKRLRPFRIWEPPHGNEKEIKTFYDQKLLKRLIKEAKFTVVPRDVADAKLVDLQYMYKDFQLPDIRRADFC